MRPNLTRSLVGALAVGLLAFAPAGPARAANLDKALLLSKGKDGKLTEAEKVLSYLAKKGYKNVGVLPFQVKKGKAKSGGFDAAPLAMSFPSRLETALAMSMDASKPLGIIQDASGAAGAQKVGPWAKNKASFQKLFAANYALPYGSAKVKADAFLTGLITCTDGETTRVDIRAFDRNSLKGSKLDTEPVASFTVENDRALLRELGFGYVLPRTAVARGTTAKSRDKAARSIVSRSLKAQRRSDDPSTEPADVGGIQLELFYNGQKQLLKALTGEGNSRMFEAPAVPSGATVSMTLKRVAEGDKLLGAVLAVNGKSTWNQEPTEGGTANCTRWLFKPGNTAPQTFKGFYMGESAEKLLPWKVFDAKESETMVGAMGARAGWIDLDVYESNGQGGSGDGDEMQITLRGLARSRSAKPANFKEYQASLLKANNVKPRPRSKGAVSRDPASGGIIGAGVEEQPSPPVGSASFPNPTRLGGISIRYYQKASGGSGGDADASN